MPADVRRGPRRNGFALLDVLVALVVLGVGGVGLVTLLGQTAHSMRRVRDVERETREASDELGRLVTYDRARLVAMIGLSHPNGWSVTVAQSAADLFDVAIAANDTEPPLLRTTAYRPDTVDAHAP